MAELDQADMVVEFSTLKKSWRRLLTQTLDHSFLAHVDDPILPSLHEHIPDLRLVCMPGDPTTELLASLLFLKMDRFLAEPDEQGRPIGDRVELAAVHVQETETNGVTLASRPPFADEHGRVNGYAGWWSSPDPDDRSCVQA